MKTVVVFREGQNGNFFKLLVENYENAQVDFRITDTHPVHAQTIDLTHDVNFDFHHRNYQQVLRILPEKKIYLAIYNNFMKKLIREQATEDFSCWQKNPVTWYDICYYNIVEYYQLICNDIGTNQYTNLINFDLMLDENYLDQILNQYFGISLDNSRKNLLDQYRALQLEIPIDSPGNSMLDILSTVTDHMLESNPWFFSFAIHKFETVNHYTEKDRKWSINDLHGVQNRQCLIDISSRY